MCALVADKKLMVYKYDGFWQCMDIYRGLELLNRMWAMGNRPWKSRS